MKVGTRQQTFLDYDGFVDKFKPRSTTDDCMTPPEVYEAVRDWACEEYGIDPDSVVRPFWPGGDYRDFDYPEGCTVIDNPPFSILSEIKKFYLDNGIPFFLFCPSLTALSGASTVMRCCHVICDCGIVYENGARVQTSFVTSYGGDVVARTAPDITRIVNAKVDELRRRDRVELPRYEYPDNVVTAAMMQRFAKYGVEFEVGRGDCARISALDAQRPMGKAIYGGGLLLSERAAAERAAAERAAAERAAAERAAAERANAHVFELSDREKGIVSMLGGDD